MFRRRLLPRRRRRILERAPLRQQPPAVPGALIRANQMAAHGNHAGAAWMYAILADGARERGMPVRAAHLDLQSSRAFLAAGEVSPARSRALSGLLALVSAGRSVQAARQLGRMDNDFRDHGHALEADQIQVEVSRALAGRPSAPEGSVGDDASAVVDRGQLPTRCPGCGARLLADEIEWRDATTATCVYCGSAIRAE